ncbi:MAG: hypothetical protein QNJ30_04540 [Kiloniellales bacterium]|nr:hypothetical protein [Kiloniellales bacterium]
MPTRRWRLATLCLLAALLAAACGPVPRPFRPDSSGQGEDDLLLLRNGGSLKVLPLQQGGPGGPDTPGAPAAPRAMAEYLAAALRADGFAATTRAEQPTQFTLRGRGVVQPLPGGREEVLTLWELVDAGGKRLGQRGARSELAAGAWRRAEPQAMKQVARQASRTLLSLVRDPEPTEGDGLTLAEDRVLLAPIEDAPGDSGRLLPKALLAALRRLEPELLANRGGPAVIIVGEVGLGDPVQGWQSVAVTWRVLEAVTGEELGRVDQRNQVPAGSLDRSWAGVVLPIAEGAAAGIADLLAKAKKS